MNTLSSLNDFFCCVVKILPRVISTFCNTVSHHTLPFVPQVIEYNRLVYLPFQNNYIFLDSGSLLCEISVSETDLVIRSDIISGRSKEIKFLSEDKSLQSIIISVSRP